TGTGKEIIAETIHYNSHRSKGPLIKVSCAILSREILESELFGHTKGAFTGAQNEKKGRFELANEGTIFLDDIDDIPIDLQVKLLRVLQEKEIERVGGTTAIPVDVRVIASTKNDLYLLSQEGRFRSDLYYRLNVFPIYLPPLRKRKEDIPLLLEHFLQSMNPDLIRKVADETISILLDLPWEGNVRELKNLVERLSVNCKCNPIVPKCLPLEIVDRHKQHFRNSIKLERGSPLPETVKRFEMGLIKEALTITHGNKEKAAKILGIPVSTLKSKLRKNNHRK
ncbi:MAG: sigma 54-interacting transcriptional regulator, partial [bacterium]